MCLMFINDVILLCIVFEQCVPDKMNCIDHLSNRKLPSAQNFWCYETTFSSFMGYQESQPFQLPVYVPEVFMSLSGS